ncbi:MAG: DUF4154 domain-containing protein [Candidatus Latescibacteria bacterium]|nr:DUF4154 domain-containing protein [bacterium]MBD3423548.1 DUF4154 domain-containing protein [Candidatus Latescibacterota bacterium]
MTGSFIRILTSGNSRQFSAALLVSAFLLACFPKSVHISGLDALAATRTGEKEQVNVVKAAYLRNFLKYVGWPDLTFQNETVPISIYITRGDFARYAMEELHLERVRNRRLRLHEWDGSEESLSPACNVVYVDGACGEDLDVMITLFEKRNILSIGSVKGFAERGGIIELIRVDGNIRFIINTSAAERAGITIESQLLRLAKIVRK